ncbi:hypothetical protein GRJ2_001850400 [Grus japonensis]|uniref:Uncharacterized protein n=1 Tax=Grus japonensis TaxID=30415 RepID=A0ABC9X8T2_GRUJA
MVWNSPLASLAHLSWLLVKINSVLAKTRTLVKFNEAKCKVLHMGWGNPHYQYRLVDEGIESSSVEKDLAILVDEKLGQSSSLLVRLMAHGDSLLLHL